MPGILTSRYSNIYAHICTFLMFAILLTTSPLYSWIHTGNLSVTNQNEINALADSLTTVTGNLEISGNTIADLSQFAHLQKVEGNFLISECSILSTLTGLDSLISIGNNLYINQCPQLTSMAGLGALKTVQAGFKLWMNTGITSLDGMNLQSVNNIGIAEQYALTNIDALASLTSPLEYLELYQNNRLTNLDGFANIPSCQRLLIVGTSGLENFCGLLNIALSPPFGNQFTILGTNAPTRFEIIYDCSEPNRTICCTTFFDENGNGVPDKGEFGLKNITVHIKSNFEKCKHLTTGTGECRFVNRVAGDYQLYPDLSSLPADITFTTTDTFTISMYNKFQKEHVYLGLKGNNLEAFLGEPLVFPEPEIEQPSGELAFVNGSPTYSNSKYDYGWNNAIDHSIDPNNGTVWAQPCDENPWAIFEFSDHAAYQFDYLQFQTENGQPSKLAYPVSEIEVLTSNSDTSSGAFSTIGTFQCKHNTSQMQWFRLPDMVSAKYIKLKLLSPISSSRNIQLLEFAVNTKDKQGAQPAQNSNAITPAHTVLSNYPNPFNPQTTIQFNVQTPGNINLRVYSLNGKLVKELLNEHKSTGEYKITWNAAHMPSGVYFIRLQNSDQIYSRRILLMK